MGQDKAGTELAGEALVSRVLARVKDLFDEVFISAHGEDFSLPDRGGRGDIEVVKDAFPGRGPSVGLLTTLSKARNPWVFIIGCDHPLVSPELVHYLSALREGHDAVVPRVGGRVQTLCALYKKSCIEPLKERVLKGERGLVRFLKETGDLSIRYVEEDELKQIDPGLLSFVDVDTPADLVRVEKILKNRKDHEDC